MNDKQRSKLNTKNKMRGRVSPAITDVIISVKQIDFLLKDRSTQTESQIQLYAIYKRQVEN